MRLNPILWNNGTQLPSQLTCKTKHVKFGDNRFMLLCHEIAQWIVADNMQNYNSESGPYSSVH